MSYNFDVVSALCPYYQVTASATPSLLTTSSCHILVLLVTQIFFAQRSHKGLFKLLFCLISTSDLYRHLAATSATSLPRDRASARIIRSKCFDEPLYILKSNMRFGATSGATEMLKRSDPISVPYQFLGNLPWTASVSFRLHKTCRPCTLLSQNCGHG